MLPDLMLISEENTEWIINDQEVTILAQWKIERELPILH